MDRTIGKGVTILSATDVHRLGPDAVLERVRAVVGDGPAYFSFSTSTVSIGLRARHRHAWSSPA